MWVNLLQKEPAKGLKCASTPQGTKLVVNKVRVSDKMLLKRKFIDTEIRY